MSSADWASFISSFSVCPPFTSFAYLIALARTSSTMVNKSGESGCLCLVLILRGKHLMNSVKQTVNYDVNWSSSPRWGGFPVIVCWEFLSWVGVEILPLLIRFCDVSPVADVFVFCGCRNKLSHIQGLKTTQMYYLTALWVVRPIWISQS